MSQAYSNPKRESDPHALPDVEVFYVAEAVSSCRREVFFRDLNHVRLPGPGWYWWACLPGCLPDSDPFGPFKTESEALADAQANADDDESED